MEKGKGKKKAPVWKVFLQGSLLALGVYLTGAALQALLLVKGVAPESAAFPVTGALCLLAALCGGMVVARKMPWGTLPSALMNTAVFAAVLLAIGGLCWKGITWAGQGGVLLLCALAGGVLAGVLGGRRVKRRKRK